MNFIESKHVFRKGEATIPEVMRILEAAPTGATVKVLPFLNGDIKELVVKFDGPRVPSTGWPEPGVQDVF